MDYFEQTQYRGIGLRNNGNDWYLTDSMENERYYGKNRPTPEQITEYRDEIVKIYY